MSELADFPLGIFLETKTNIQDKLSKRPFPFFHAVSIFPPSILITEAEASLAETAPLCLTKHSLSDTQTHAELPSSTMLGQPQSPATLQEEKSGVRRRSQGSPAYVRSKIKVRKTRNDYARAWSGGWILGCGKCTTTIMCQFCVSHHR